MSSIAERLARASWQNDKHITPNHEFSNCVGLVLSCQAVSVIKSSNCFTNRLVDVYLHKGRVESPKCHLQIHRDEQHSRATCQSQLENDKHITPNHEFSNCVGLLVNITLTMLLLVFHMPDSYITGLSGMLYCNQTPSLVRGGVWARDYTSASPWIQACDT